MGNLSYCRFENTLADLTDCEENLHVDLESLSESERRCRESLIRACSRIAADWGDGEQ